MLSGPRIKVEPAATLAHHIILRLTDDRVVAQTIRDRRVLASAVLEGRR